MAIGTGKELKQFSPGPLATLPIIKIIKNERTRGKGREKKREREREEIGQELDRDG